MANDLLLRPRRCVTICVLMVLVFGRVAAFDGAKDVHVVVTVRDLSSTHLVKATCDPDPVERREVCLDSALHGPNGSVDLNFTLDRARPVLLKFNNKEIPLFLEPGDDLKVTFSDTALLGSIAFSGKGAGNCRYLTTERAAGFHVPTRFYSSLEILDARAFTRYVDSVESAHWAFYRRADTMALTPRCRVMIRANITYQYLLARDMFGLQKAKPPIPVWYYNRFKELNLNDQQAWDNVFYIEAVELFLNKYGYHSDSTLKLISNEPWVAHAYHEITRILRGPIRDVHHARLLIKHIHILADDQELASGLLDSFRRSCRKPFLVDVVERYYSQAVRSAKN